MRDDIVSQGSHRSAYGVTGFGVFDVDRDDAPVAIVAESQIAASLAKQWTDGVTRMVVRPVMMARIAWEVVPPGSPSVLTFA